MCIVVLLAVLQTDMFTFNFVNGCVKTEGAFLCHEPDICMVLEAPPMSLLVIMIVSTK